MTNGDKIRSMDDNELMKFILDVTKCCSDDCRCADCPLSGTGAFCNENKIKNYLAKEIQSTVEAKHI